MEQQRAPQSGFQNFTRTIPGHIVGIVLAIGFGLLGMYSGLFSQCCGLGFILIACSALYIPKIFGITKVRHLVAMGVAFFLILTAFGTFVVSKPMLESNSVSSPYNSEKFFEVDTENGKIIVPCNETLLDDVKLNFNKVQPFAYLTIKTDNENPHLIQKSNDGCYKSDIKIENGCIYQYSLEKKSDDRIKWYYLDAVDDTELVKFCLLGNAYYCGIIFAINMLMLFFGIHIRKNLENMRAKMEAEGRLYPQGYGHCKECGSIILPGEICCRRCGAYIEVPDELRHRKVDMVQCSECEAEIPRDAKTCPKCGVTFDEEEEVVYVDTRETDLVDCPECGMKIPSNAKFCPKCGVILDKKEKI